MTKDEALKMAIEVFDMYGNKMNSAFADEAYQACKEALATNKESLSVQPIEASKQKPIAELVHIGNGETFEVVFDMRKIVDLPNHTKFYTSPQAKEWQGLTKHEIIQADNATNDLHAFAYAINAKLKDKNTQKSPAERQAEGALNPSPLYPTVNSLEKNT
jgi:hypothetical protein